MKIEDKKIVTLKMKVVDQEGQVMEDTPDEEPFVYLHGAGGILPALETVLSDKSAGETVTITLKPEDSYGEHNDTLIQEMPASQFEGMDELQVGDEIGGETPNGIILLTVIAIDEETVTVDANHPFAGKTLKFDLTIVDVRDATKEELEHGHAHDAEGECS